MAKRLGELEQFLLYALVALGDEAYGASIHREIEARSGRSLLVGAVYTLLDRLESRGLVASWVGEPTAARGGRRRKHYRLTPAGARLLLVAHEEHHRMVRGLGSRLARLAER
ncbi:MAG TPA: helix-turn-helix transcriptional regulator [Thermoanaerobaculia bacterium]|nr:helix-turn-helix transcriptional regulator [Thermoanaerobaculia bacterium]